jgi:hypothetical protein
MSGGMLLFIILYPGLECGCIVEGQAFRKGAAAKSQIGPEYGIAG